jgi:DNA-binding MarR family transcriptional regulator
MNDVDESHVLLSEAKELGHESRAHSDDHMATKLWLRLLSCATQIEDEIRRRLRARFDVTLGRFDFMAQLYRFDKQGLKMGDLSRYLMMSGGNVTLMTDEMEREGWVVRVSSPNDRRSWIVKLTPKGRKQFEAMASEHEQWVQEMFAGLDMKAMKQVYAHLGKLRVHLVHGEGV